MNASPAIAAVIGAGPAGLMAAERLAGAGVRVTLYERMPSAGRKLLMAGRGGLNLTHSEPLELLLTRYGAARDRAAGWLAAFGPDDLRAWAQGLGQRTFVGSSGRVFPESMKSSPLLRAWLARLESLGVELRTRTRWTGWRDGALTFDAPQAEILERPDVTVLALGGASWPRLGSDGAWTRFLPAEGVTIAPLRPANAGFDIAWSPVFRERFAGQPLKGIAIAHGERTVRGEAMIAAYGIEGGAVYALSAALRDAIERDGRAEMSIDLKPDVSAARLLERLSRPRGRETMSNFLRKAAGLGPAAIGLLREAGPMPASPETLAARIKAVTLTLTGAQGLARAISSAGGVTLDALDERLMLRTRPGVFAAGEMLDWEAPTGGYLLQACLASGMVAADGALAWLAEQGDAARF